MSAIFPRMPLRAEGTVSQLQWIHHYLFQDVYEWTGRIRTIDMGKTACFVVLVVYVLVSLYLSSVGRLDLFPERVDALIGSVWGVALGVSCAGMNRSERAEDPS